MESLSGVVAAARHDAAGRHDEAVNALARATQAGDLEAMTTLACRLLVGDRAPLLPQEAVRFLVDAAQQGHAEAPAQLAVLTALGAHVRQSWMDALDLLATAAERGSTHARGQLRILAGEPHMDVAGSGDGRWGRLARRVDVAAWSLAPPRVVVNADPLICRYPDFVDTEACAWLIERSRSKLRRALVYDPGTGDDVADSSRTNTAAGFNLAETDLVHIAVQTKMSACCRLPITHMEGATVLHYECGEEIANHFDFVDPAIPGYEQEIAERGERVVTFLVYLNDDYGGGETEFPKLGVRHKGRTGEGLFFVNALPAGGPDVRMVHAGRPPTRGEKWIVSQFVRDRPALRT